jgi:hypothetical protein
MTTPAITEHKHLARPLKVLVPLIRQEIEAGDQAGIEHYRRAGEMLLEAKEQLSYGEWIPWLKRNFELSRTTANRYMKLAQAGQKNRARRISTLSELIEPHRESHHQPAWHEPVRESINKVNVEKLVQERQDREKEERLVKEVAIRLIDIGYRALAAKLHPDKGGSAEAMARLNKARDLLKRAV